jgi:hypothetical protein
VQLPAASRRQKLHDRARKASAPTVLLYRATHNGFVVMNEPVLPCGAGVPGVASTLAAASRTNKR